MKGSFYDQLIRQAGVAHRRRPAEEAPLGLATRVLALRRSGGGVDRLDLWERLAVRGLGVGIAALLLSIPWDRVVMVQDPMGRLAGLPQ